MISAWGQAQTLIATWQVREWLTLFFAGLAALASIGRTRRLQFDD